MTSTTTPSASGIPQVSAGPIDPSALQQVLLALMAGESDSDSLLRKTLSLLVNLTGACAGANFRAKGSSAGPELWHALWPQQLIAALPELPGSLAQLAAEVTSSGRAGVKSLKGLNRAVNTDRWVGIGSPVMGQEKAIGAICLVLDLGPQGRADPYVVFLQAVAACFQIHVLRRLGGTHQLLSQQMSVVLDAVGRSVTARNAMEMSYFLCNEVRQHLDCYQVSIGWWSGLKVKVAAISGQARFNRRGDAAEAIRDAMCESLRQERSVSAWRVPPGRGEADGPSDAPQAGSSASDAGRPIDLAHQRLMDVCQSDRVVTHPLRNGDTILGAWTFQWRSEHLPSAADERLISVATGQIGPLLDWARRADQGVLMRGVRSASRMVSALIGEGHMAAKGVVLGIAVLLMLLVFVRVPFRVGGDCVLQPTPRRYITARFDGVLQQAYVRPGEVVSAGTLLAQLEDFELKNELGRAQSERHRATKEADSYWSKGKLAEAQMARLEAEKFQAQVDQLEYQLKHVRITAPIEGVILSGDLERARGVPVQRGQVLFELAPLAEMTLEVAVPDSDAGFVAAGQRGEFALQSRPERTFIFSVERVRPQAEIRNEKNVFVAEATVKNVEGWLRPGMQGTAKVDISRRSLGWILSRRLVNWVRMTFWW